MPFLTNDALPQCLQTRGAITNLPARTMSGEVEAISQELSVSNPAPARPEAPDLIRWSVQEVRRIAVRLARRRIHPAHVIAWSLWRRAHQAAARRSHLKRRTQL